MSLPGGGCACKFAACRAMQIALCRRAAWARCRVQQLVWAASAGRGGLRSILHIA